MKTMKKLLLLTAIAACLLNCEPKKSPEINAETNNNIVVGQKAIVHSDILKEDREIWIHLPQSASNATGNDAKYPVLYLLDGDAHFYSVTGMINQLSTTNGNTITPEMIVVGITNTDRTRDLTPTHMNEMYGDSLFTKSSGGGKNFLDFIEKELVPYVEKNYPATGYKTFVGHSLGGLMVIDALVERPNLFNNYVAIDPSLWWDDQELLIRASQVLSTHKYDGKALYVGIANTMFEGMNFKEVERDTTETTQHIRSIKQFVDTVASMNDNGLHFKWKYYEDDSHGSVPLITEYDALRFLFPWHELKGLDQFFEPNSAASADDLLSLIDSHYKKVSDNFGYEVLPPESFINQLGYAFMNNPDDQKKSNALLSMNIQNYPNSSNVYDSMGDCYLAQKDSVKALELFKKALEVGHNDYSQEKIDMLKEQLSIE